MASLDDNSINCLQSVIQANGAPSTVNAQLDVWNTSNAAPFTITYQFAGTNQPVDLPWGSFSGWTAMTTNEQAAIRAVLAEYESVCNVKFIEVTGQADPDTNFGKVNLSGEDGIGGWSFSVGWDGNGNITSKTMDHFAVFKNTFDLSSGHQNLLLHEIGHSMTLRHPGNYDVGGNPPPPPYLPAAEDNNKYTVMSYNANPDNGQFSDHLMLYDIAALQARLGANISWHTGSDLYTGPNGNVQCIWDADGTDTFDASGKVQSAIIDLNEGAFSSLGGVNNLSIAYGAVIENAVGSNFTDTITGNNSANFLQGSGGNDTINGGVGFDTIYGGSENDQIGGGDQGDLLFGEDGNDLINGGMGLDTIDGGAGNDTINGGVGGDTIFGNFGFDEMHGSDGNDTINGGDQADVITGDAGDDFIGGGMGLDSIDGGIGNDTITGGMGDDLLTGGAHADTFAFGLPGATNDGVDTITDFVSGTDSIQISATGFGGGLAANGGVTLVVGAAESANSAGAGYFILDNSGADAGTLYWDVNGGNGADAVAVAVLTGVASLQLSDFHVV